MLDKSRCTFFVFFFFCPSKYIITLYVLDTEFYSYCVSINSIVYSMRTFICVFIYCSRGDCRPERRDCVSPYVSPQTQSTSLSLGFFFLCLFQKDSERCPSPSDGRPYGSERAHSERLIPMINPFLKISKPLLP